MKNISKFLIILIFSVFVTGCASKWLEEPKSTTILLPAQVWRNIPGGGIALLQQILTRMVILTTLRVTWD